MGVALNPFCSFFSLGTMGSFLRIDVGFRSSGGLVSLDRLSIGNRKIGIGNTPSVHLLNDDSQLTLQERTRKVCMSGLTAVKKN